VIGIDTNVLVRLLVRDDERQSAVAIRYLTTHCASHDPGLVADIVFVECAWVLAYLYDYTRAQIGDAIEGLLSAAQLRAANASAVSSALQTFRSSSADFADCLLGINNAHAGCAHTATFDRKAAKLPEFELLS
jgi:predicted nucleic-acid-binding protein